jgi:hypothetical protein
MESATTMLMHSIVIGLMLYTVMVYLMNVSRTVAEDKSVFIACIALIYMLMFGHGLPTKINPNLFA